jgi:hypothetical protein
MVQWNVPLASLFSSVKSVTATLKVIFPYVSQAFLPTALAASVEHVFLNWRYCVDGAKTLAIEFYELLTATG